MTGLDVEAARKVLLDSLPPGNPKWRIWVDGILERLTPCVIEDPQAIDREALAGVLMHVYDHGTLPNAFREATEVIRLLGAVEGVTLTPEEAADAAQALHIAQEDIDDYADQFSDVDERLDEGQTRATAARMRALRDRLAPE